MIKRYGDNNWRELLRPSVTEDGLPEALPRRSVYGSLEAANMGLVPLGDYPDLLVQPDQFKEVIAQCRELQLFPEFHQHSTWAPPGFRWNQNGWGWCWEFGCVATVMDCRAAEGKSTVLLAPNGLGWLVNWRNQGYFLDETINGAAQRGIPPASHVPDFLSNNPKTFKDGWETEALKYRPLEWWDTQKTSVTAMIQQCLTILKSGRSLYVGNDEWGHAYDICGMKWDETEKYNVVWVARNSHDEDDQIELVGDFGVPDEAYGPRATIDTE
jgi:hypothetical protein